MRKALAVIIIIGLVVGGYIFFVRKKGQVSISGGGVQQRSQEFKMTVDELYAAGQTGDVPNSVES